MAKNAHRTAKGEKALKTESLEKLAEELVDRARTEGKRAAKKSESKSPRKRSVGGAAKHKQQKKIARTAPRFRRALNKDKLEATLNSLSQDQLFELQFGVRAYLYWSIGDPTVESLHEIARSLPALSQIIDFDTVIRRLDRLREFERSSFGVSLKTFFPELVSVSQACSERIIAIPKSVAKAESWLRVVAADAAADADLEAAVYLASRGDISAIDVDQIRDRWHASICTAIERGPLCQHE